ncbi:MAG: LEPR-XLL domain-containing protein, partial [Planctomycetes bacterium]|nr:LEPR-XLL domain-containing protein [Planctomycetota bacterium]
MSESCQAPAMLEGLEPRLLLAGDLWITELMAVNDGPLADADGEHSDWVEIYNASGAAVDLAGWHLTDDPADLTRWTFPSVTLDAGDYLVVFASGKDRVDPAELHTDFKLSGDGEYLALVAPDGVTVEFEYAPTFPPQTGGQSYGIVSPGNPAYFATPTPGAANVGTQAAPAIYSAAGGTFTSGFSLTLSTTTPGATIHYTTNGSMPTSSSPVYSGPISISNTTRVRTLVRAPGLSDSPVTSETYIRLAADVADFSSNLPLVVIDSYGGGFNGTTYTFTSAAFIEIDPVTERAELAGAAEYAGNSGMKIRGQSSTSFPKKQYKVELYGEGPDATPADSTDGLMEERNAALFGMPAESDWILHAPYSDKTLMRNYLSYKWFGDMGHYQTRTRYCEVFINQDGDSSVSMEDYVGVYLLIESIKGDDDRVDIDPLPDDPISPSTSGDPYVYQGGFIIEKETSTTRLPDAGGYFHPIIRTSDNWVYTDPEPPFMTQAQKTYVKAVVDRFHKVIYNQAGFPRNDPQRGYPAILDVMSFIDYELMQELTNNNDGYYSSVFMHLNTDNRLAMGPVWDFNIALGNHNGTFGSPTGWQAIRTWPWWTQLFGDADFYQGAVDRWGDLRSGMLSVDAMMQDIDDVVALLAEAQPRDQARWDTLGEYIWPNPDGYEDRTTYLSEVNYLKNWLTQRVNWIDAQYPAIPNFSQANVPVDPGTPITMTAAGGTIYYTLDGSDPRLPGGGIAPGATSYSPGSTSLQTIVPAGSVWKYLDNGSNQGTAWRSPSFNDGSWASGPAQLGYGDGDEATVVSYGPNSSSKYITTYFRHAFTVDDASDYLDLTVRLQRDDGAIVYLNGTEIVRDNLTTGTVTYTTGALDAADGSEETTFYQFSGLQNLLVDGTNVLAVEIHQRNGSSSDVSFDMMLQGSVQSAPTDGIPINGNTQITARLLSGGDWSAPSVATYAMTTPSPLAITEINYNPYPPTLAEQALGFTDADLFEFVELANAGAAPFSLAGFAFAKGIDYTFAPAVIDPGERVVIVRSVAAFQARYGTGIPILGTFDGALSNSGERIVLQDGGLRSVVEFAFGDSGDWPGRADGKGATLEVIDPLGDVTDPDNWRSSGEWLGTPGAAGAGMAHDVIVNEVLTHTDLPALDAIELRNTTAAAINIGGWYLSDSDGDYFKYRIPAGTTIPAGGYLVFDAEDFSFGLSSLGEDVWLMAADAPGHLTRFVDHVEFDAAANGESFGRWPNAVGELYPMASVTLGAANSGPRVGPVILSEVLYAPATLSATDLEFVEIHNPTGLPVDLTGWRLGKDVDFDFPAGTIIAAGGTLVVTPFDPADPTNATRLSQFRAAYGIDASVPLVGGWAGELADTGGYVQLQRPDDPPAEDPTTIPYLIEDEVRYGTESPWPVAWAQSLQRVAVDAWGNDPSAWTAAAATAGAYSPADFKPGDINLDGAVDLDDFVILKQNFGAAGASWGQGDLTGEGTVDLDDFVILKNNFGTAAAVDVMIDDVLGAGPLM